jgi:hypothetical protein
MLYRRQAICNIASIDSSLPICNTDYTDIFLPSYTNGYTDTSTPAYNIELVDPSPFSYYTVYADFPLIMHNTSSIDAFLAAVVLSTSPSPSLHLIPSIFMPFYLSAILVQ